MIQAMKVAFQGGCLCGNVRYNSRANPITTVHCYCTDCRRLGGTGHATHTVIPEEAFDLIGDVSEYQCAADSGNLINRRFCPTCGSAIFHTREGLEGKIVVRTSSMDDPEIAKPDRIIYASSAVSWDHLDPALPTAQKMTGSK
ncbi:MAG: GFA family protein [Stappiaceae bacterium]